MAKPPSHEADRTLLDAFWREPVDRTILPNGLTLLVKPDRSAALASVQVWVKTGSIHEGEQLGAGLSHFLEHMLFKGTARRSGREISATVQANGGYINAYTTFDRTVYYIDLPSERLEVAVDVLADAVLHSALPEEEVVRERDVILREIAMTRDDPDSRLWEALFATAFREHPYRHPIIGYRDVFAAVDRKALLSYYTERYVPNNIVVVVAGDVEAAQARALVERHFGGVPRARLAPVLVPAEPLQLGPRSVHRTEKVEIVRAALAWPIPGLTDPSAPALDLLALVLGEGDSSILWQEIRDRLKLVHSISASSWNPGSSGLFCISYTCDAGKREKSEAAILRVLRGLSSPGAFTARQARKAQRQSVVAEINTYKTMSGQASRLGMAEVVVGDLEFSRNYFERLRRSGPPDLARALKAFLVPERLISVALEPESAAVPAAAAPAGGPAARPDFEELRLPNGARMVFQRDRRLPNLQISLLTHGGPMCEAPERRGSSALLATLLTKDTRRLDAAQVARRIEEVGGSFSSYSGDNSLGLSVEVLPADADLAVELLCDGALEPAFRAETLGVEREAQLAGLREDNDDVVAYARRMLRRRFFGAHPFALSAQGDEVGVSATAAADLAALWKRLLVGPGVVMSIAGDFDPGRLLPRLKAFLLRVPRGPALAQGAPFEGPAEAADFVERQPREQAVVLQAFPGTVLDAADFHAGEVADELFSGMASRLFERVRDQKGLAYFIRSGRVSGGSAAMFYFISGTQPGKEAEVLGEIGAEIERVQSGGVSAEELLRCQVRLKAGRRKSLQTNSARAMLAGLDVLQGRPANHWKSYDSLVDSVTLGGLADFARRHLRESARVQLVVRP
ncbi:MAG TPA: pitrilysin family protein [Opitutaceae bacterium]|nr:pitrilysin family protein [Opitutaceae bacterium]